MSASASEAAAAAAATAVSLTPREFLEAQLALLSAPLSGEAADNLMTAVHEPPLPPPSLAHPIVAKGVLREDRGGGRWGRRAMFRARRESRDMEKRSCLTVNDR